MKKTYLIIFSLLFLSFSLASGASATLIDDGDGLTATFFISGISRASTTLAVGDSWIAPYRNAVSISEDQITFSFVGTTLTDIKSAYKTFGIQVGDIDGSFSGYYIDTNIADVNYTFANGTFALDISGTSINTDSYLTATMHNPIPAPILLLGTGLIGLAGFRRKVKK